MPYAKPDSGERRRTRLPGPAPALLAAGVLGSLLLGSCSTVRVYPPEGDAAGAAIGETLSVVSLNIRYDTPYDRRNSWEERREALLELLRGREADLLALQEVSTAADRRSFEAPRQLDDLTEALAGYTAVLEPPAHRIPESLPLFVRRSSLELEDSGWFYVSDQPRDSRFAARGARLPRHCLWALLRLRGTVRRFYVFNVHLSHRSRRAREGAAAMLLDRIEELNREQLPVIVVGDLNAPPGSPCIALLTEGGLRDAHQGFPGGTAHGFTGLPCGPRVDYILVSEGFTVRCASIERRLHLGRLPSDHFPVAAVLAW